MRKLITCPETAHLEEIELEDEPLGTLIVSCSRYPSVAHVDCPRTCAARMDRIDRARTVPTALSPSPDDTTSLVIPDVHEAPTVS